MSVVTFHVFCFRAESLNEGRHFPNDFSNFFSKENSASHHKEWHPPLVPNKKSGRIFGMIRPEGTMRFSFLLRIPITFSSYLLPLATTGRHVSDNQFLESELSQILNKFWDFLSCAVKNFEEAFKDAERGTSWSARWPKVVRGTSWSVCWPKVVRGTSWSVCWPNVVVQLKWRLNESVVSKMFVLLK